MKISKYFHLEEFTDSQAASRLGLRNTPSEAVQARLATVAKRMDSLREHLGHPIIVSSGYRSPAVNKAIGGSPTSDHTQGWAVDWTCPGFGIPLEICKQLVEWGLNDFDQLIQEGTWVHLSFAPKKRGQILTRTGKNKYKEGL